MLLARDDTGAGSANPTAGGALHWAPLGDDGLRDRMQSLAEWVATARPDAVVVDVSVEVTVFLRLLGVPVIVMAMPGDRTDPPHELVYRLADHIVAAWPRELYAPTWLRTHSAKTTYVGGISRFDGRERTSAAGGKVLILNGSGGSTLEMSMVDALSAAHPQFGWSSLGVAGGPWTDDPWPALCSADVVISSAGQSSVADIAAARRPAIIVAAQRPFAEQHATARALADAELALVRFDWPAPADWPALIDRARSGDPRRWQQWQTDGAAGRAATVIEHVAAQHRPVPAS